MAELPIWTREELKNMEDIRGTPSFYTNCTKYFFDQMDAYIENNIVFRISIMGTPRFGKTEVASMIAFIYTKKFNDQFDDMMKKEKLQSLIRKKRLTFKKLEFTVDCVYDNQIVYKTRQRERGFKKQLVYGQIHLIDERKSATGGLGSGSENIDTGNINNITAVYNQAEIWVAPDVMQTMNCVFGLVVKKKDETNRVNWCALHSIEKNVNGGYNFIFQGFVCIKLHKHDDFRDAYDQLKDKWVYKEITGRSDELETRRKDASIYLLKKYPDWFELKDEGKEAGLPVMGMKWLIERVSTVMTNGEIPHFNIGELDSVVRQAVIFKQSPELLKPQNKRRG
jgi:hypothetical protein